MITTVAAMTQTHLEVMGQIAWNLGNKCTKRNKINHDIKIYPSLTKATENLDLKNLIQSNTLQKLNINCKNTQSEKPAKLLDPELSLLLQ